MITSSPMKVAGQHVEGFQGDVWRSEEHVQMWINNINEEASGDQSSSKSSVDGETDSYLTIPDIDDEMEIGADARHYSQHNVSVNSPRLSPLLPLLPPLEVPAPISPEGSFASKGNHSDLSNSLREVNIQILEACRAAQVTNTPFNEVNIESSVPQKHDSGSLMSLGSSFDNPSSLAAVLQADPEEILLSLGFGGGHEETLLDTIPARFFKEQSTVSGIDVAEFQRNIIEIQDVNQVGVNNVVSLPHRFSSNSIHSSESLNSLNAENRRILYKSCHRDIPSIHLSYDADCPPTPTSTSTNDNMNRNRLATLTELSEPGSRASSFEEELSNEVAAAFNNALEKELRSLSKESEQIEDDKVTDIDDDNEPADETSDSNNAISKMYPNLVIPAAIKRTDSNKSLSSVVTVVEKEIVNAEEVLSFNAAVFKPISDEDMDISPTPNVSSVAFELTDHMTTENSADSKRNLFREDGRNLSSKFQFENALVDLDSYVKGSGEFVRSSTLKSPEDSSSVAIQYTAKVEQISCSPALSRRYDDYYIENCEPLSVDVGLSDEEITNAVTEENIGLITFVQDNYNVVYDDRASDSVDFGYYGNGDLSYVAKIDDDWWKETNNVDFETVEAVVGNSILRTTYEEEDVKTIPKQSPALECQMVVVETLSEIENIDAIPEVIVQVANTVTVQEKTFDIEDEDQISDSNPTVGNDASHSEITNEIVDASGMTNGSSVDSDIFDSDVIDSDMVESNGRCGDSDVFSVEIRRSTTEEISPKLRNVINESNSSISGDEKENATTLKLIEEIKEILSKPSSRESSLSNTDSKSIEQIADELEIIKEIREVLSKTYGTKSKEVDISNDLPKQETGVKVEEDSYELSSSNPTQPFESEYHNGTVSREELDSFNHFIPSRPSRISGNLDEELRHAVLSDDVKTDSMENGLDEFTHDSSEENVTERNKDCNECDVLGSSNESVMTNEMTTEEKEVNVEKIIGLTSCQNNGTSGDIELITEIGVDLTVGTDLPIDRTNEIARHKEVTCDENLGTTQEIIHLEETVKPSNDVNIATETSGDLNVESRDPTQIDDADLQDEKVTIAEKVELREDIDRNMNLDSNFVKEMNIVSGTLSQDMVTSNIDVCVKKDLETYSNFHEPNNVSKSDLVKENNRTGLDTDTITEKQNDFPPNPSSTDTIGEEYISDSEKSARFNECFKVFCTKLQEDFHKDSGVIPILRINEEIFEKPLSKTSNTTSRDDILSISGDDEPITDDGSILDTENKKTTKSYLTAAFQSIAMALGKYQDSKPSKCTDDVISSENDVNSIPEKTKEIPKDIPKEIPKDIPKEKKPKRRLFNIFNHRTATLQTNNAFPLLAANLVEGKIKTDSPECVIRETNSIECLNEDTFCKNVSEFNGSTENIIEPIEIKDLHVSSNNLTTNSPQSSSYNIPASNRETLHGYDPDSPLSTDEQPCSSSTRKRRKRITLKQLGKGVSMESSGFDEDATKQRCSSNWYCNNCNDPSYHQPQHSSHNSSDTRFARELDKLMSDTKTHFEHNFQKCDCGRTNYYGFISHNHFEYVIKQLTRVRTEINTHFDMQAKRESELKLLLNNQVNEMKQIMTTEYMGWILKEMEYLKTKLKEKDDEIEKLRGGQH